MPTHILSKSSDCNILQVPYNDKTVIKKICVIDNNPQKADQYRQSMKREFNILRMLRACSRCVGRMDYFLFPEYYDYNEENSYILMENIDGETLTSFLNGRQLANTALDHAQYLLTSDERISLMECVYQALLVLYEHDICHLDLNPSNFIVISQNPMLIRSIDFTSSPSPEALKNLSSGRCAQLPKLGFPLLQPKLMSAPPYFLSQCFNLFYARLFYISDTAFNNNLICDITGSHEIFNNNRRSLTQFIRISGEGAAARQKKYSAALAKGQSDFDQAKTLLSNDLRRIKKIEKTC